MVMVNITPLYSRVHGPGEVAKAICNGRRGRAPYSPPLITTGPRQAGRQAFTPDQRLRTRYARVNPQPYSKPYAKRRTYKRGLAGARGVAKKRATNLAVKKIYKRPKTTTRPKANTSAIGVLAKQVRSLTCATTACKMYG